MTYMHMVYWTVGILLMITTFFAVTFLAFGGVIMGFIFAGLINMVRCVYRMLEE